MGSTRHYGCGTGLISNEISNEIADNVKVIHAIDTSSKMIEIAKNKADGRKIENIDYAHSTIFDEGLNINVVRSEFSQFLS
jgi:2-polyprenyl-3-methyl-5-hydroxy-6-metoxy-1,4-benzoquinol methylase